MIADWVWSKGNGMETRIDGARLARVEHAAQSLCAAQGSFELREIVAATHIDRALVRMSLAALARQGKLLAWPGERFAQPIDRASTIPAAFRPSLAALRGAR